MILAILNLHVAPMPPTKFGLNPTKGSGARLLRWLPWGGGGVLGSRTKRFKQF